MAGVDIQRIRSVAEPVLRRLGYELWDLNFLRGGQGLLLRVTIDGLGGVTLDDCARASRELSPALDVENVIHLPYSLEVTSPGLERVLKTEAHFERMKGSRVHIRVRDPIDGRRHFDGSILGCTDGTVTLEDDSGLTQSVRLDSMQHANVVFVWERNEKRSLSKKAR